MYSYVYERRAASIYFFFSVSHSQWCRCGEDTFGGSARSRKLSEFDFHPPAATFLFPQHQHSTSLVQEVHSAIELAGLYQIPLKVFLKALRPCLPSYANGFDLLAVPSILGAPFLCATPRASEPDSDLGTKRSRHYSTCQGSPISCPNIVTTKDPSVLAFESGAYKRPRVGPPLLSLNHHHPPVRFQ